METNAMSGPAVLAVDPGKTTGWAWYSGETDLPEFGQVPGRNHFYEFFWDTLASHGRMSNHIVHVVVERYIISSASAKMSAQYDPLMIIGALEQICTGGGVPFTLQPPNKAKRFLSNAALKELGWWKSGSKYEHAMDAARHLGLYLVESNHPDADDILCRLLHKDIQE